MKYILAKDRAKIIRQALVKEFGNNNVSVRKGRGTASSWVEASVESERPANCTCQWETTYWNGKIADKPFRATPYCEACKEQYRKVDDKAKIISSEAMKAKDYEHTTYYVDDGGYNTEAEEFLLQVNIN